MKIKHLMFGLLTFCIIILLSINVKSTDKQWSPEEMISEEIGTSSYDPSIAVDSQNNIHVIWQDYPFAIYYKKLKGHGWGKSKQISDISKYSRFLHMVIDKNDKLHILFLQNQKAERSNRNYQIAYLRIDAITNEIEIGPKVINDEIYWSRPDIIKSIVIDNKGIIHAIGNSFNLKDVTQDSEGIFHMTGTPFYLRLDNNGELLDLDFSISTVISEKNIYESDVPIGVDSLGNIYIFWGYTDRTTRPYKGGILYSKYDGYKWSDPIHAVERFTSWNPRIAFDKEDNLHLLWLINNRVYYKKFNGLDWGIEKELVPMDPFLQSQSPEGIIVNSKKDVHLFYEAVNFEPSDTKSGVTIGGATNSEIYYLMYDNSINKWTKETRLTNAPMLSKKIALALDNQDNIHLVWEDFRFDSSPESIAQEQPEVFYRRYSNTPYTCSDGIQNGDETDIDCGGSCLEECKKKIECKTNKECREKSQQCFVACSNGECTPITGMPAPPCEESIWLDYPDCKWDESKCIIKEEILVEEPKEELEVQVSKEELGEKEQSKSFLAKIISFIKNIFS